MGASRARSRSRKTTGRSNSQLGLDDSREPNVTLHCGLTPAGRIDVQVVTSGEAPFLPIEVARRIEAAFLAGSGRGILQLGAGELSTELPPALSFWREFGQQVLARVCAATELADEGPPVVPEPLEEDLAALVVSVPPMPGAETLTVDLLCELWSDTGQALVREAREHPGGVQGYLKGQNPVWNVLGRVCLHLAENKRDPEHPFAFIATYVHKLSKQAKPAHLPLSRALAEYAGAGNRQKLLELLAPLSRAAERSELVAELVESGAIYQPQAWTPSDAHRFLLDVAAYEQSGLVVRLPDWWHSKNRARPRVSVTIGGAAPGTLGTDGLLDFDVDLTLGGAKLSKKEIAELLQASEGLLWIKGRWVEVNPDQLSEVLAQWQDVQKQARQEGVSFGKALRLLAGFTPDGSVEDDDGALLPEWSQVVAGKWLTKKLEALRSPDVLATIERGAGLKAELRPYQKIGVQWLTTLRALGLGGCLADDMGLGKTIQVLGALTLSRGRKEKGTDLLVVPASLVDNWRLEIERFAPQLSALIAHPSRIPSPRLKKLKETEVNRHDVVITTYGTVLRTEWMKSYRWRNLILDEAQAIKNPGARQTRAIKQLNSEWRLALTGTPVENRLTDLWSVFDFLNPGLLGSAQEFGSLCKAMSKGKTPNYAPLRRLLEPYILRRLKTDKAVIADLPDKTEVTAYCLLSKRQAALYGQSVEALKQLLEEVEGIQRRGAVLAFLMRLKQICNHPSQWLGDDAYDPADSGKLARLRELCEPIAARQDKVLVFTQFREMTGPLADYLAEIFGRAGLVLHGGTPVKRRQQLVKQFQEDERVPFMVLSLKAGGTGLNLTAASHVVHFDRWWNPAVENQATDRAFRIGQKKNVLVHKFVCRGTVEERIDELIASKQQLSDEILSGSAQSSMTELDDEQLLAMVSLDLSSALEA